VPRGARKTRGERSTHRDSGFRRGHRCREQKACYVLVAVGGRPVSVETRALRDRLSFDPAFLIPSKYMRALALLALVACAGCAPEVWLDPDLRYANARTAHQTASVQIRLLATDLDQAYDVLGDLEVIVRQRGAFGDLPTRAVAEAALREQAGRLGAHAVILVAFGQQGTSGWSYNELRGHGRAIRFR
jgi:hypothetical protein